MYPLKLLFLDDELITSESLRACRACLATNTSLYNLHVNNLVKDYSDFSGTPVILGDGLPQHICGFCYTLLRKGILFGEKCRNAYYTLQEMLDRRQVITTEYIRNLPNVHTNVVLSVMKPLVIDIPPKILQCDIDSVQNGSGTKEILKIASPNLISQIKPDPDAKSKIRVDNGGEYIYINFDPLSNQQQTTEYGSDEVKLDPEVFQIKASKTDGVAILNEDSLSELLCIDPDNVKTDTKESSKSVLDYEIGFSDDGFPSDGQSDDEYLVKIKSGHKSKSKIEKDTKQSKKGNKKKESVKKESKKKKDTKKKSSKKKVKSEVSDSSAGLSDYSDDDSIIDELLNVANDMGKKKPPKRSAKRRQQQEETEKKYNVEKIFLTKEEQIKEFESRKLSTTYKESDYKCDYCYKGFVREIAYKNHMETHDPNSGSRVCDICHTYFDNKSGYWKHKSAHKVRFKCKMENCSVVTNTSTQAAVHFNWHNGVMFKCEICQVVYNKKSTYLSHLRLRHCDTFCSICNEGFVGEKGLQAHMKKVHRKAVEYRCSSCGVQFQNEASLQKHVTTAPASGCTDLRPCEHCGTNYTNEPALLDHMQEEHNIKVRCDECCVTFKNALMYKKHRYREHGQRIGPSMVKYVRGPKKVGAPPRAGGAPASSNFTYMCEICGHYSSTKDNLKLHQRTHTGEKPFHCTLCPKRFTSKACLKMHMNTHTGLKPYKCRHCPKTFAAGVNRNRHMRMVHLREKFSCHLCDKTYFSREATKMHIRTIHMKEPWPKRVRNK